MIHTRPFFVELRRAFPNAKITISIISSYSRGVPEDLVDRVHVVHRKSSKKQNIFQEIKSIRELGYHDLVFDLCDTPRSRMILAMNPAKAKIGFTSYWLIRELVLDINVFRSDLVFEADMLLQLLNILGIKTSYPPVYELNTKESDSDNKYIVYFPSASDPGRYWEAMKVVSLISRMAERYPDSRHLVLKGIGEEEKTDSILGKLTKFGNVAAVEKNDLAETTEFIGQASLVVSNDTSIRHLAIAVGTPSVGIYFGPGRDSTPFRYWPRWGCHEAAFEFDGSQPSVENVFSCCCRLLETGNKEEN